MPEAKLKEVIRSNLSKVLEFDPYSKFEEVENEEQFSKLLCKDPAFAPFYLHDSKKYVTARVWGNLQVFTYLFTWVTKEPISYVNSDIG